jgi:hypothetical protein
MTSLINSPVVSIEHRLELGARQAFRSRHQVRSRPSDRPNDRATAHGCVSLGGETRRCRKPRDLAFEHKDAQQGQSAKEVMAAIEAVKPGKGPLTPESFIIRRFRRTTWTVRCSKR